MSDLIETHAVSLEAAGYSPITIAARIKLLRRISRDVAPGLDASAAELAAWFSPYDGWTLYTHWHHANGFYTWACAGRTPHFDYNPMSELVRPRTPYHEPNPMPDDEIARALQMLREPWRRAVLIATLQGLRCAEICRLDREHINPSTLFVDRKGGSTQLLPTHPDVWTELSRLPPGPVVRRRRGQRFSPNHLTNSVSFVLTRMGLPDGTLHRFRASFATRLADAGVHVTVIQDLMGHRSLKSTQGYIKVRDEKRRLAIQSLLVPTTGNLQEAA